MRSGGNVSTVTNNAPIATHHQHEHQQQQSVVDPAAENTADGASAPPSAKCKAMTIPIFLKSKLSVYIFF